MISGFLYRNHRKFRKKNFSENQNTPATLSDDTEDLRNHFIGNLEKPLLEFSRNL